MQTLPVISTPSAAPAQPSAPADGNDATQATEPFGKVLARQRAGADASQAGAQANGKQGASSSSGDATTTAAGKDAAGDPQAAATDAAGTLPADVLAALLPAAAAGDKSIAADKAAATDKSSVDKKAAHQAPLPDGAAILPAGMPLMSPPVDKSAGTSGTGKGGNPANAQGALTAVAGDGKKAVAKAMSAILHHGETGQKLPGKTLPQTAETNGDKPLLPHAQPDKAAAPDDAKASQDKAFATALGAARDGVKAKHLDADLTKNSQPNTPTDLHGVSQSSVAATPPGQSGTTSAVQATINTPVAQAGWGDELNQNITWMATQHAQTAELHLNPPHLGPLDVVLNVKGDQATALFSSPHALVRDAVEQALPRLRDMMADSGIMLGNAMVSDQSPRDQQFRQSDWQQGGGGSSSGRIDAVTAVGGTISSGTMQPGRRHLGMVDTFV